MRGWWTVLTVASSLAVALWWKNGSFPWEPGPGTVLRHEKLVAASAAGAPVLGRRSGFPYLAEGSPEEDQSQFRQLARWRERLQRNSQEGADPVALWQVALVDLATGVPERAVPLLETAVNRVGSSRAQALNDLAVAYLARSEKLGRPRDRVMALDAAGRAGEADPALPEACFNKAMALGQLYLVLRANAVWQECLRRETDPGWRSLADRHRRSLQRLSIEERWKRARPALAFAARSGDSSAVAAAVAVHPQGAREEAIETTLVSWAEAVLQERQAQADAALSEAQAVGEALGDLDADFTVDDAVRAAEQATGVRRMAQARGLVLYRKARRRYLDDEYEASAPLFEQAGALLRRGGSPVWVWAELGAATTSFYRNDFEGVLLRLENLKPHLDEERHPVLAGRWHWLAGMAHSRRYDLQASADEFREAAAHFERTREDEHRGAGQQLLGETSRLLGNEDEAWRYRIRGLKLLQGLPFSRRRQVLLRDITESLLAEGRVQAALEVRAETVQAAAGGTARDRSEAFLWSARVLARQGQLDEAASGLSAARAQAGQIPAGGLRDRMLIDVAFAEADLEARRNPTQALALLDRLVEAYRDIHQVLPLTSALARRAEVAGRLGLRQREMADLAEGIDLFEGQWRNLSTETNRLTSLQTAQKLFDTKILREVKNGSPTAALETSERARAFWTGDPGSLDTAWVRGLPPVSAEERSDGASRREFLPSDVVVLEYALAGDRMILFLLRPDGLRMVTLARAGNMEELVGRFRGAAQALPPVPGRFRKQAEALYNLLLRPVIREIPAGAAIVIVPDKALYGLPFGALRDRDTGRFLLEDREIAFAPSASFFRAALRRPPGAANVGDALLVRPPATDLPEGRLEVADLRGLYPHAEVLDGADATRERLLAALDSHSLFHYIGHADIVPSDPFHGRLRLGSEEVTLRDLQGRQFRRLELVVLSACSTLAAEPTRTGGFLGLARPFLSGGVRAVVGTLWNVADADSRAVLVAFHRELRAGRSPSAALREAQRESLRRGDPPSAWAAFAVVGEAWRPVPVRGSGLDSLDRSASRPHELTLFPLPGARTLSKRR